MNDPAVPYIEALLGRAPLLVAVQRFAMKRYPGSAHRLLRNAHVDLGVATSLLASRPPSVHIEWLIRHSERADVIDRLAASGACSAGAIKCLVEHWRLSAAAQGALVATPNLSVASAEHLLASGLEPDCEQQLLERVPAEFAAAWAEATRPPEWSRSAAGTIRRGPPRRQHVGTSRRDPRVTELCRGVPRLFQRSEVSAGRALSASLGDDLVAWEVAFGLMPTFEGTCSELAGLSRLLAHTTPSHELAVAS